MILVKVTASEEIKISHVIVKCRMIYHLPVKCNVIYNNYPCLQHIYYVLLY